ncbi:MAG: transporter [Flavobacteriales bacterium]|nr:transporter [Flavobacteriales bacterium]
MMRKKIILITNVVGLGLFFCSVAQAQFGENIRSGRPGQGIGPYTVGKSILQFQAGVDYQNLEQGSSYSSKTVNPNIVIRYGIWELFEVSTNISYVNRREEVLSSDFVGNGLNAVSLRIRSNIIEAEGKKPALGWQFGVGFPLENDVAFRDYLAPRLTIITAQSLGKSFSLSTNWGINWDGNFAKQQYFNVCNLGYGLNDKWSIFIEEYGGLSGGKYDANFDAGLAYLVNSNFQLDMFGGYDKGQFDVETWFVSLGLSWRTTRE